VTTDSYRLALCEATLQSPVAESFEAVLPGNLFRDIIKAAADADEISIGIADSQLVFTFGDTEYVTRRIEGTYPNYSAVLPSSHKTTAVVDTEALTAAVRQASLLSQSGSSISLAFSKEDQNIHVSSQSQDVGQASVYVDAQIEGLDLTTAYNHQYLLDGLSSIKSEKTLLEFESANRPGILRPTSQDKALYLVMPVRLG
jgi:DNA polymerase-3 subunit beta